MGARPKRYGRFQGAYWYCYAVSYPISYSGPQYVQKTTPDQNANAEATTCSAIDTRSCRVRTKDWKRAEAWTTLKQQILDADMENMIESHTADGVPLLFCIPAFQPYPTQLAGPQGDIF